MSARATGPTSTATPSDTRTVPVQALVCTQNGQWAEMPSSDMPR